MSTHKPSRVNSAPRIVPLGVATNDINRRDQRQADAKTDEARPLRYVRSMGKRLKAESDWTPDMKRKAHAALIAWNKP